MSGREGQADEDEEPSDIFSELYRIGLAIFCDDAPDFPEIISHWGKEPGKHGILTGQTMPDLPIHPHHWILGAVIMAGSAVAKVWTALESSRQLFEVAQEL